MRSFVGLAGVATVLRTVTALSSLNVFESLREVPQGWTQLETQS